MINNVQFIQVIKQIGINLDQLHKQIMQFKNWLRGTHQKCASEYLFAYVHEYEYRFNKRNMRKWLANSSILSNCQTRLLPFTI